eukprot:g3340.t1
MWGDEACGSWVWQNKKGCNMHATYRAGCAKACQHELIKKVKPPAPSPGMAINLPDWFVKNPLQDMRCGEAIPFVDLHYKFVMCTAPKSASTSWRKLLTTLFPVQHNAEAKQFTTLEYCPQKLLRLSDLESEKGLARRIMADPSFFKYAMVRNPITRLLSGYLMWAAGTPFPKFLQDNVFKYGANTCSKLNNDWSDLSQHWYPQHCRCGFQEGVKYDFIGKMEDIPATLREIRRRGVIPDEKLMLDTLWAVNSDLTPKVKTKRMKFNHETKAATKLCKYFTLELFDKLAAARSDEISFFGYDNDVQELRAKIETCHETHVTTSKAPPPASAASTTNSAEKSGALSVADKAVIKWVEQDEGYATRKVSAPREALDPKVWHEVPKSYRCPLPDASPLRTYCADRPLNPTAGADHKQVLEIGLAGHTGVGFWSQISYMMNQLIFADKRGFVPFAWLGAYSESSRSPGDKGELNPYYAKQGGPNVWTYFFMPVSSFRPFAPDSFSCCRAMTFDGQMCLAKGCRWGENSIVNYYYAHDKKSPTQGGGDRDYDEKWYRVHRERGNDIAKRYVRFQPHIAKLIERARAELFPKGKRTLGIHVRGTDKVWGGGTITPADYVPFIKKYLEKYPDTASIFMATDSPRFMRYLQAQPSFGSLVKGFDQRRTEMWASVHGDLAKTEAVFMDSILLSMCDYLLLSASAVAEAAIYFNPALHEKSLNLQYKCGHPPSIMVGADGCMSDSDTPIAAWGGRFEGCNMMQAAVLKAMKAKSYTCCSRCKDRDGNILEPEEPPGATQNVGARYSDHDNEGLDYAQAIAKDAEALVRKSNANLRAGTEML